MTVSLIYPTSPIASPAALLVLGHSLDGSISKIKFKNVTTGAYLTFRVLGVSSYLFQIDQFNPVLVSGNEYSLEYDGRELYRLTLSYPMGLSGIYYLEGETYSVDNYYDVAKKIPNPTIRTALIGE